MRRALLLFILAALLSCRGSARLKPATQAASHRAPEAPVPLEEYFKIKRVDGLSFSHDEKLVAYASDEGGRLDVWVQPLAGGKPTQVTHVAGFVHSFAFSPAADRLAYEADAGGDELPHLFLTNSKGESPRDIVAEYPADRRTEFVAWADDGKTLLFRSNRRDPQYMDLYEYNLAKDKAQVLWQASGKMYLTAVSRHHKRFILTETNSDADSNLYLLDRGKANAVLLTRHHGEVLYDPKAFSRDANTLYFTSDQGGEFTALYAMDLATKTVKPVLQQEWDVEDAGLSRNWTYFWTLTNVDGTARLALSDAKSHRSISLIAPPSEGGWHPISFSNSDRYLSVLLRSDSASHAIYILDLKQGSATKVTEVLPDSLKSRPMASGESIRVTSFDGRQVPAFLFRPSGPGPFPAVIDVHGGPTAQSRRDFNRLRQYLVSKGYVVLAPNVRGSTGYGKSYTKLDNLDLGGGPLQDVVECKKWLVKEANVAPDRVVVLGGSYGGYMALSAATFTPDEFAANVDYFGISDLKSLVESFPPYWAAFATYIYKKFGDPKNPEHANYQHDRSPLNFVERIQRPLLVVQGEKDARVKKDQSDRLVQALEKRSVPVHYLVIPNEGHGFSKNENFYRAYQVTDRFLDRYIFGDASVDVLGSSRS